MAETVFAKIIRKEIPAKIVHEDEHCLAFHDVSPQAPVHVLVIPKKEIESLEQLAAEDADLLGHLWLTIVNVARELGLSADGYRVVVNCGRQGGQSVDHLHFHILGGRNLGWPPGSCFLHLSRRSPRADREIGKSIIYSLPDCQA